MELYPTRRTTCEERDVGSAQGLGRSWWGFRLGLQAFFIWQGWGGGHTTRQWPRSGQP